MVSAVGRLRELLGRVADAATVARDGYLASPRWCGLPPPLIGKTPRGTHYGEIMRYSIPNYPMHWSLRQWMIEQELVPFGGRTPDVTDEASAHRYHALAMGSFINMFRNGIVESSISETPRKYLDRVRGELRYSFRFDMENVLTKTFALMKCVKEGRPKRPPCWPENDGSPPLIQQYGYVPLPSIEARFLPGIEDLADAMKEAFDRCSLSLMPKKLSVQQRVFLEWITGVGGRCRPYELMDWMRDDRVVRGSPDRGQGPERTLLRTFCDKDGRKDSRGQWVVRPEAILLLESI